MYCQQALDRVFYISMNKTHDCADLVIVRSGFFRAADVNRHRRCQGYFGQFAMMLQVFAQSPRYNGNGDIVYRGTGSVPYRLEIIQAEQARVEDPVWADGFVKATFWRRRISGQFFAPDIPGGPDQAAAELYRALYQSDIRLNSIGERFAQ